LLPAILALALFARLGFASWVVGLDAVTDGDEADYHAIATSVAAGAGFASANGEPTARRPPAYPHLLAAVYRVAGPSRVVARLLQVAMGVAVVALVFLLARRHFDERTARVAAALAAVNPFLTFISGYLLTENLYMLFVLGALVAAPAPSAAVRSTRRLLAGAGLLALAALTRPSALPLALWMGASIALFAPGRWTARARATALAAAVFLALITPWMIRNATIFGGWVGLTTHGGVTFLQGNNQKVIDIAHYRGGVAPVAALPGYGAFATMNERDRDRFCYAMGRRFLHEKPGAIPKLAWWKFARFWRLRSEAGLSGIRSGWWFDKGTFLGGLAARFDAGLVYALAAIPLFVAGLVLTRARWRDLLFLYGVVAAHTAVALVFFGSLRGRIPVEPVIAVFAAPALLALLERLRRGRGRRAGSEGGVDAATAPR
jgi:4-amino-4-deoxy-L-arabinose transferase-like glycosyltransferase